jgi:hypothetical protein
MIIERFFGKGRSGETRSPAEAASPQGQQAPAPPQAEPQPKPKPQARAARVRPAAGPAVAEPAKTAPLATAPAPEPTYEEIAARAYDVWIAAGRPEGRDHENWMEAERQLRAERVQG